MNPGVFWYRLEPLPALLSDLCVSFAIAKWGREVSFSLFYSFVLFLNLFLDASDDVVDIVPLGRQYELLVVSSALFRGSHRHQFRKFAKNSFGTAYKLAIELIHIFLKKLEIYGIFLRRPSSTWLKSFSDWRLLQNPLLIISLSSHYFNIIIRIPNFRISGFYDPLASYLTKGNFELKFTKKYVNATTVFV